MNRRALAGLVALAVLIAGCSSIDGRATTVAGAGPSTSTEATGPTLGTPTSSSTTTRSSTSSSTSSSTTTGDSYPWRVFAETHPVPSGFRAASPDALVYAAVENNQLCVNSWAGDTNCLLDLPADLDLVFPVFSAEGNYLAVVVTKGTDSGVWIIDLVAGVAKVVPPMDSRPTRRPHRC